MVSFGIIVLSGLGILTHFGEGATRYKRHGIQNHPKQRHSIEDSFSSEESYHPERKLTAGFTKTHQEYFNSEPQAQFWNGYIPNYQSYPPIAPSYIPNGNWQQYSYFMQGHRPQQFVQYDEHNQNYDTPYWTWYNQELNNWSQYPNDRRRRPWNKPQRPWHFNIMTGFDRPGQIPGRPDENENTDQSSFTEVDATITTSDSIQVTTTPKTQTTEKVTPTQNGGEEFDIDIRSGCLK